MRAACELQLAAFGRNSAGNRDVCVVVEELAISPGQVVGSTCSGPLLCKVVVTVTGDQVLPALTVQEGVVAWEPQGGAGSGVHMWEPPGSAELCLPGAILVDNSGPGCGPCVLLIQTKLPGTEVPDPGTASALVDARPVGLSEAQRAFPGGCSAYMTLPHCRPAGAIGPAHTEDVVDEVRWVAGLTGTLMFEGRMRLRVSPALTAAVQCQAIGRVENGWCCVPLGTWHVGRFMLAHVAVAFEQ
jgi:hypothetical protein